MRLWYQNAMFYSSVHQLYWYLINTWKVIPFNVPIAISTSTKLGSNINDLAMGISVCLMSLIPCMFSSWLKSFFSPIQNTVRICKYITILIFYLVNSRLVVFLKLIYTSIQMCKIFVLFVSCSLILSFGYSPFFP